MLSKYFYNLSLAVITFVFIIFAMSNVGFVLHYPIQYFYSIFSFISVVILLFFLNKNKKDSFFQIIIFIILLYSANCMSNIFIDYAYDSLAYHFQSMYLLKNGWNPIFLDAKTMSVQMGLYSNHIWVQGWSKFCEIVSANFYLITNQISSGQIINFLMAYASFMSIFCALDKFNKKTTLNIFFSFLLLFNPVVIGQMFTMYIDLHIYFAFLIILSTIIQIEKSHFFSKSNFFILIIISTIFIHIKFSGLFYLALISIIYLVYLLISKKNIFKYISAIGISLILATILGVHPFYTNYQKYEHPFYPLFGKHKEDVIKCQITIIELQNKNSIQKAIMSTFAVQTNLKGHIKYRFPFVIKQERLYEADMRLGGMGHFWSAIIIIALIFSFGIRISNKSDRNIFITIISIILLSYLLYPDPWWMRYVPQIWMFPILVLYLSLNYDNYFFFKKADIKLFFTIFMFLLIILNSSIVLYENIKLTTQQQKEHDNFYRKLSSCKNGILIYPAKNSKEGNATIYSYLKKYNINYKIVDEKEYVNNKLNYQPMEEFAVVPETYFWKKQSDF